MKKPLFLIFLFFEAICGYGQTVFDQPLVLPEDGQTSYVVGDGQNVDIIAPESITLKAGVHIQAGAVFRARVNARDEPPSSLTDTEFNFNKNWTLQRSYTYDAEGERVEVSSAKIFFNDKGEVLQSQSKAYTHGRVMARQSIRDYYGRSVIQTLSAPINPGGFSYKADFTKLKDADRNLNYTDLDVLAGYDASQDVYTRLNTQLSLPLLDSDQDGTLGKYYSANDTHESHTPESSFPYSRTEFYSHGSGEAMRAAMPGEELQLGSGHESYSKGFPVGEAELKEYVRIRNEYVFPENPIGSLEGEAVAQVNREANGEEFMSISDAEGKVLAAFVMQQSDIQYDENKTFHVGQRVYWGNRTGPHSPGYKSLPIKIKGSGIIQVINMDNGDLYYEGPAGEFEPPAIDTDYLNFQVRSLEPFEWYLYFGGGEGFTLQTTQESDYSSSYDFYVPFDNTTISITDKGGYFYDILNLTENTKVASNSIGDQLLTLSKGFYRFQHQDNFLPCHDADGAPSDCIPFYQDYTKAYNGSYEINYHFPTTEASYNYYDARGRLHFAITPNGVKQLREGTAFSRIDKTSYEYSAKGELLSVSEPDAGITEYMYRRDGSLRFSQNAEQRLTGHFSYTNYNALGQPVESGEFNPEGTSLNFGSSALEAPAVMEATGLQGGLSGGARSDWVRTYYNLQDEACPRTQQWVRGAVSYSENEHSKTWYSYDYEGKVSWMVQHIKGLSKDITLDYTYDNSGSVTAVAYQKDLASEAFFHTYEYDADLRLYKVSAGRSLASQELQATYHYYLHGPLKRVALADKLQGIDYVYTIQGWLKAINHPENSTDPGMDGNGNGFAPDIFGMTLEYFSGDYARTGTNIASVGVGQPNFNGNISAMHWSTKQPASALGAKEKVGYQFKYDRKGQLTEGQWGTPDFATQGFTSAGKQNKLSGLSYDANGNIVALKRYDADAGLKHDFSYNYQYEEEGTAIKTNQLSNVEGYRNYHYDALGQLREEDAIEAREDKFIRYNVSGKVVGVYTAATYNESTQQWSYNDANLKISYTYDDRGFRLLKKNHENNIETWYVRDASGQLLSLYTKVGGTLQQKEIPLYGASHLGTYDAQSSYSTYELKDHLGNVRATISRQKLGSGLADVKRYADYYPFGSILRSAGAGYRYGYQGEFAEDDTEETGWNSFELRQYDPVVGRWTSVDPERQFFSPYIGMGNNPTNGVDSDGGRVWFPTKAQADRVANNLNAYFKHKYGIENAVSVKAMATKHWGPKTFIEFLFGIPRDPADHPTVTGHFIVFNEQAEIPELDEMKNYLLMNFKAILNSKRNVRGELVNPEEPVKDNPFATVGKAKGVTDSFFEFRIPNNLPNYSGIQDFTIASQTLHELLWHISHAGNEWSKVGYSSDQLYQLLNAPQTGDPHLNSINPSQHIPRYPAPNNAKTSH